jgi:DNA repair protein RadC
MNKVMETIEKNGIETMSTQQLIGIIIQNDKKVPRLLGQQDLFVNEQIENPYRAISGDVAELKYRGGLTDSEAYRLAAAVELSKRINAPGNSDKVHITSPRDGANFLMGRLRNQTHETFIAVYLDTKNRVMAVRQISEGSLTCAVVHPREVYAPAVVLHAAAILVAHNHPSGDPRPSDEDKELTRALSRSGDLLGIQFLDHVVIGDGRYYSFKEHHEI